MAQPGAVVSGTRESKRQRLAGEQGSAPLEFITVGMLLFVPLVYLILTLSAIQAGVFAVEGAARQAARVFVQSATVAQATERAHNALYFALADHGLNADAATITVTCSPNPAACLARSGFVTVTVLTRVSLPLAPPVLDVNTPFVEPRPKNPRHRRLPCSVTLCSMRRASSCLLTLTPGFRFVKNVSRLDLSQKTKPSSTPAVKSIENHDMSPDSDVSSFFHSVMGLRRLR